jgi:hypothetical protein
MYYQANQQRFNPFPSDSLFANQNYLTAGFPLSILPFVLPTDKNFKYGYAQQANLTIERVIAGTWKLSAGYQWTRGIHLNRPVDINPVDPVLLTSNAAKAADVGIFTAGSNPLGVSVPVGTGVPGSCYITPTGASMLLIAPGVLGVGFPGSANCSGAPVGYIGTPSVFNDFRKSGPNPSFAGLVGGFQNLVGLAQLGGFPGGIGIPAPYLSVDTQKSDASSWYNALTVNLQKAFSKHFELLSSYTWSHSIDNGTDLQSTLEPADSRFPQDERGNSVNDQRHRWVTSGVFMTSPHVAGEGFARSFFSNFTVAPLVEVSSGRPFNVITGEDTLLDGGSSEIRPSVVPAGTPGAITSPYIKGVVFGLPTVCRTDSGTGAPVIPGISPPYGCTGNLGRDRFVMPMFFQFDMRISKGINLSEHLRMDLIADGFNLFNHTNITAVNALCDPSTASCLAGQPTSASDARQFQFALKLSW